MAHRREIASYHITKTNRMGRKYRVFDFKRNIFLSFLYEGCRFKIDERAD